MTTLRLFLRTFLYLLPAVAALPGPARADATQLRSRHAELRQALHHNGFGRALHIASAEGPDALRGEVHAVLDHSFEAVSAALRDPATWCDILILPFNTKACQAVQGGAGTQLQLRIGRRSDQSPEQAQLLVLGFQAVAAQADYFETRLGAGNGPYGTRDYRLSVAAIPLDRGRTFLRLDYSYGFGTLGRMAMQAYLATAGADKIGFSVVGQDAAGQPRYIQGVRGAVERNVMRHYLAIDAVLDSLQAPLEQRVERRLRQWFGATERFPRQLHEMDWPAYAAMKRQEIGRQAQAAGR